MNLSHQYLKTILGNPNNIRYYSREIPNFQELQMSFSSGMVKIKKYSANDYSFTDQHNKFYHWIENICIPIGNHIELEDRGYSIDLYIKEIRKQIYASVNEHPEKDYHVSDTWIEGYLEKNNIPIDQVHISTKLFIKRVKMINLIGKDQMLIYFNQHKLPPSCTE